MSAWRQRLLRWIAVGGAVFGVIAAACWFFLREPTDIRYRPAGDPPRDIIGITASGQLIKTIGSELHLLDGTNGAHEIVLSLPDGLVEFNTLHVQTSDDNRRIIAVTDRGLAVWHAQPPYDLARHWIKDDDPLGGRKLDPEYQWRRRFELAYVVSPDGRHVCVYPVEQHGQRHDDSKVEGTIVIRDLDSGEDVASLVHSGASPLITQVVWSGDSQRLVSSVYGKATVWSVAEPAELARLLITASGGELWLSRDGTQLVTRAGDAITLYNVEGGAAAATRRCGFSHGMACSPNAKYLLVGGIVGGALDQLRGHAEVAMFDAKTLTPKWTSKHPGACGHIAFSPDGKAVALGWRIPNEIFGSTTGVKAWDVDDGTVVLDDESVGSFWGFDSRGQIVTEFEVFEPKR